MTPHPAPRRSGSRLTIAIIATVGLLAAVVGCWLLRVEGSAGDTHAPAAESIAKSHTDFSHLDHAHTPVSKAPAKSAGLRRARPPMAPRLASVPQTPVLSIALHHNGFPPLSSRAGAPATTFSVGDTLTRLCIDRR